MEDNRQDFLPDVNLQTDEYVKDRFLETAKWSKFVAIVVFIVAGIFLIFGLWGATKLVGAIERFDNTYANMLSSSVGAIIGVVVFIVLLMVFINYFLFSFSVKIKSAFIADDKTEFNSALQRLKTYFIASTVVAIIALLFNIIKLFQTL